MRLKARSAAVRLTACRLSSLVLLLPLLLVMLTWPEDMRIQDHIDAHVDDYSTRLHPVTFDQLWAANCYYQDICCAADAGQLRCLLQTAAVMFVKLHQLAQVHRC